MSNPGEMTDQPPSRRITLPDGSTVTVGGLTKAEQDQMIQDLIGEAGERLFRGTLIRNVMTQRDLIKDIGQDWIDQVPPYQLAAQPSPANLPAAPTGAQIMSWTGTYMTWLRDRDVYLWQHSVRMTQAIIALADGVALALTQLYAAMDAADPD